MKGFNNYLIFIVNSGRDDPQDYSYSVVLFLKIFYIDRSIIVLKIGGYGCGLCAHMVKSCTKENT